MTSSAPTGSKLLEGRSASGSQLLSKGLEQRRHLIQHATRIILEHGVENLVMRRLASDAGMKLGNLQYYFATKEDLLEGVLVHHAKKDLENMLVGSTRGGLQGALEAVLEEWQTGVVRVFALIFLSYADGKHNRFAQLQTKIYGDFYSQLAELMRRNGVSGSKKALYSRAKVITTLLDGSQHQVHTASGNTDEHKELQSYNKRIMKVMLGVAHGAI